MTVLVCPETTLSGGEDLKIQPKTLFFRLESVQEYGHATSDIVQLLVGLVNTGDKTFHSSLVQRERAESLASHYQIPHFQVDCRRDPKGLDFVMDTLVTMVMTKALESQQLSQTIRPYSTTLDTLSHKSKTRGSRCSSCCSL